MTPAELIGTVRRLIDEVTPLRVENEKLSPAMAGQRVESQALKDESCVAEAFAASSAAKAFRHGEGDGSAGGRGEGQRG